jgi:nucleoside-diphosphate-sugar epimerase
MIKIFIAGHNGMVGSAITRIYKNKIADGENIELILKTREELNLISQEKVNNFYKKYAPDIVIISAAKVGGIFANNEYPAEFIYENLMIQNNLIHGAYLCGVKKLLFLGSSCIYPKHANQPMNEEQLLTGCLEPTNEPYAIAKIAGIKLCESYNRQYDLDYRCIMPTNLYGPGDNYHSKNSHVIPALIKKFHEAKVQNHPFVEVWGSGNALREFLYVDDMALASIFLLNIDKTKYLSVTERMCSHVNVGSGEEMSIADLANLVSKVINFKGDIIFNTDYPDGPKRKLLDSSKIIKMGWNPTVSINKGITSSYEQFKNSLK